LKAPNICNNRTTITRTNQPQATRASKWNTSKGALKQIRGNANRFAEDVDRDFLLRFLKDQELWVVGGGDDDFRGSA
jgi:hypothetical protein